MKLLFENRIMTWFDSFDFFDEIGRRLFRVSPIESGSKRLKVYSTHHNKCMATLYAINEKRHCGVGIKHEKRFVTVIEKFTSEFSRICSLGVFGWRAKGEFEKGCFAIYDGNGRVIAKVGKEENINHVPMRCIDMMPEFCLFSITCTLAIDILISESTVATATAV